MDFQDPLTTFSSAYISAEPEISTFQLTGADRFVILGSDGLWDQLGRQEVAEIARTHKLTDLPPALLTRCIEHAAKTHGMATSELKTVPAGKKRHLHDDITIVVLDVSGQGS